MLRPSFDSRANLAKCDPRKSYHSKK
jgi:hypothetical protein